MPQVSKHANYERVFALCARAFHYTSVEPHLITAELADVEQHMRQALTS
jgi:hypothetical protein